MPKSRPAGDESESPAQSPVDAVRSAADAMFRAANECCHQHDRAARVSAKSAVEDEVAAAQKACDHCDEVLRDLTAAYERTAANVVPSPPDEGWWHRANALWLASREYLRRHVSVAAANRALKAHGPENLEKLHTEYELEASALLGLRHAADAYRQDRPTAA